jgi:hypothetical protein
MGGTHSVASILLVLVLLLVGKLERGDIAEKQLGGVHGGVELELELRVPCTWLLVSE